MPYYTEGKVNEYIMTRYFSGTGVSETPYIKSMVEMLGYRSKGPKLPYSDLVPDHIADPYAYFLNSARDQKFDSALKARGLAAWILPVDVGHNFALRRKEVIGKPFTGFWKRNGFTVGFEDGICVPSTSYAGLNFGFQSGNYPDYKNVAQQLYVSAAPSSEVFDLANFVGELREGLPGIVPSLLKGKVNAFKASGSDYLNVEFGWKPFLNDLINAGLALKTATETLMRPSSIVRRTRGRKPTLTSSEVSGTTSRMRSQSVGLPSWAAAQVNFQGSAPVNGNVSYPFYSDGVNLIGESYYGSSLKVERWFEGEFVQLPKIGFDPENYFSRLNELINLELTPETLWNLAPWSWLVDWHLRIGDSIAANLLAVDDRVHSVYAYAMQRTTEAYFTAGRIDSAQSGYTYIGDRDYGTVWRTTVKQRVRANPYGFTAGGADALNESQTAILAALGLTKVGR
jgi:hypothetical protein